MQKSQNGLYTCKCADDWPLGISWMQQTGAIEIFHDPDEIGPWIINKSCTIVCQKGSRIDAYAQEYGFQTEYVEISEELDG